MSTSSIAFSPINTDPKKKALFDAVNTGRVRILLGSTEKMGAGTNVQKKLKALHHLDAPWRPRDIEQREGRILRQGNSHSEIEIYRYVTEGSFDAYMWQTLENKARFIAQVMNGSVTLRQAEDLEGGALTYAEIKAIASGNPAVMEKVKVDTEVRRLDSLRSTYRNQQWKIRSEISSLPYSIDRSKLAFEKVAADIALRDESEGQEFSMIVGKKQFAGKDARADAGKALTHAILSWWKGIGIGHRGMFRGFNIMSRGRENLIGEEHLPDVFVQGKGSYTGNLNAENPTGTVLSIESTIRGLDRVAQQDQERLARLEKMLSDLQEPANRAFEHESKLKELLMKQAELNAALDLDKNVEQVMEEKSDEPEERRATAPAPA